MIRKRLLLILAGVLIFTFVLAGTAMAVPFVSPFDLVILNGSGAQTANPAARDVTQGENTLPFGMYYYYPGKTIQFRLVGPDNTGVINLGGGPLSPDTNGTLVAGEYTVSADFSSIDGTVSPTISWDGVNGYWSVSYTIPVGWSGTPGGFQIPVTVNFLGGPQPIPVATMVAAMAVDPLEMDDTLKPGTSTDWTAITDFTNITNLTFDKYLTNSYQTSEHLGTLTLGDATHPINLCEMDASGNPTAALALIQLGNNMTIASAKMSINTAVGALAALNKPATLTMYNLPYTSQPGIKYKDNSGTEQVLIAPGDSTDPSNKVSDYSWDGVAKSLTFKASSWSEYDAYIKVAGTASDPTVTMASGSTTVSADNKWTITLTAGTVKTDVTQSDLTITGLPAGLAATASKGTGNTIDITVSGTAASAVTAPATVGVVVKGSAVTETGSLDSNTINVTLNPAPVQVAGTAFDTTVTMVSGNTTVSADNKWTVTVTAGTVKGSATESDLTITGLPAGLTATAVKGTGNTIDITVAGTAASAVNTPATVGVVVKGSAVTEPSSTDSSAINVSVNPAPIQVAGTASDPTVTMASGSTTVSADNKWTITVTAGTVKAGVSASDLTITGLPAGLTATAAQGTGNTIDITVAGTAASAVTAPATVGVVVKGSAVTEPGSLNSNTINTTLNPAPVQVAGTASDTTVTMVSGNTTVSADNKWTVTVTAGTVKGSATESDLTITGLPAGLTATAAKGTGNTIDITVAGTAASAVNTPVTVSVVVKGSAVTEPGSTDSAAVSVTLNPADTAAPTWTNGSLTESNVGQTSLTLTWSGASDNVGVTDYKIYKNGTLLTNVGNVLTTNITGLTAGTQYTFRVEAGDAANNWSSSGPSKTVTTTSGGGGGGGGGGQQPPPSQPLTTEQANQDAQNQTSNITSQLQTGTLNVTQAVEQVTKVVDTLTRVEVNTETKTQLQQTVSTIVEKAAKVDTAALNIQVTEGKTTVEVTADTITKQVDQVVNTASTLTQKLNEAKMVDVAQTVTRQVVIEVPDTAAREEVRVALPVKAVDTLAAKDVNLVVATKGVTFAVPPAALKVEGAAEDAQVALTTQEVKGAEAEQALKSLAQEPNAEAVAVGKVLEFRATVETATGSSLITGFAKKVIVAIAYDNSKVSNTNKLGVYRYNDATQAWDYVGGKVQADGTIEVSLDHFSKYMVMEFNKTFIDLANHWAKSDVELMAARHVAQGVSATKFGPDASITRAEFAAILVRALGIPQQASEFAVPSYKDVKKSDWFYSSVEAAAKAGLVQRNADGTFAPKARITRQEMAAMVAQAMKAAGKEAALTAGEVASILGEFADQGEIAAWAQEAAAVAAKEGIISGRGNGMYAPKANATRAEGFAMVRRLLANVGLI